jgi:rhodanese-related sulfurtransferase
MRALFHGEEPMPIKPARELVAAANATVEMLSVDEVDGLRQRSDVQLIDVREPGEWGKGHIPGAAHAPRGLLEFKADPSLEAYFDPVFDPAKRLVTYCASGGRSALAAKTLKDMGYPDVAHLQGGITAWTQAGKPVATPGQ